MIKVDIVNEVSKIADITKVKANRDKIAELYNQKGYYLASVEWEIKPVNEAEVDVWFTVEERSKVEIRGVEFIGNHALSDDELRVIALESSDSRAKLAACWRMMIRGQAIPQVEPTEGVRGLTLLNLATVQNIEILGVVLELDPSATVRARASRGR